MELTEQQLNTIMNDYLKKKRTIREWMNDNRLGPADIRPREILQRLKAVYEEETVRDVMQALRQSRFGHQFPLMASRLCQNRDLTVEQCDQLLAKLQDAVVTVNAKKVELQEG